MQDLTPYSTVSLGQAFPQPRQCSLADDTYHSFLYVLERELTPKAIILMTQQKGMMGPQTEPVEVRLKMDHGPRPPPLKATFCVTGGT